MRWGWLAKSGYVHVAGLVAMLLLAYQPALRAGFIWDDDAYVTDNPTLRSAAGLRQIWLEPGATPQYYPLVFTTFWIEHRLWGLNPAGYHLLNILLHAANAVLLRALLRRLQVPGATGAVLLFALHPVHVESVAWITERKNVLSGTFYLASLLVYLRFARLGDRLPATPRVWLWYTLALVLFAAALFSKTVTCTLPGAIVLLIWWKRGRLKWRDILPTVPMFVLGVILAVVTIRLEAEHVGAARVNWNLSAVDRVLIAGRAVWFYLGKLLWPHPLSFVYPRWRIDAGCWWQYLFPLAALAVPLALFAARRRIGRGPLVAILYFGGTLLPALGFVNVYPMRYSFVADHFQYLASIGPLALVAASFTLAWRVGVRPEIASAPLANSSGGPTRTALQSDRFQDAAVGGPALRAQAAWHVLQRTVRLIVPTVAFAALGVRTHVQARVYHDPPTLWRSTLATSPQAWMAHNNLGDWLLRLGYVEAAARHFAAAVELEPTDAFAHNNLAVALQYLNDRDAALRHFREAVRLRPDYPEAHCNLGQLLIENGRYAEALEHLDTAVRLAPGMPEAHARWGDAQAAVGRHQQAVEAYRAALRLRPEMTQARNNLGLSLLALGRVKEAVAELEQVLVMQPNLPEAHNNLGSALIRLGDAAAAARHFEAATRLDPAYVSAWSNLGGAWRILGEKRRAVAAYEQAARLDHADPDLQVLYGLALAEAGLCDEAQRAFAEALRLAPQHERASRALQANCSPTTQPSSAP